MRPQDLHTHSLYDDGSAALEEMVCAAVGKGLSAIGLSGHSPIRNETAWTMQENLLPDYLREAQALKNKYRDQIAVFCGIEYDLRSEVDRSGFDYVIGSIHAICTPNGSFDVDDTADIASDGVERYFGGNADRAAEAYFSQYQAMAADPQIDIVGHFDLLTKFDEGAKIFDASSARYLDAAFDAMELLVRAGKIFEINTGAIFRGCRTTPYPSRRLLCRLRELGGKLCLNSDAHCPEAVGFRFAESLELATDFGFRELWCLTDNGFTPIPITEISA